MHRFPTAALVLALLPAPLLHAQDDAMKNDAPGQLPVTEVILYSSGVGFFAHEGELPDSHAIRLDLTDAQLNDALKSLLVWGASGDARPRVSYPVQEPLDRQLGGFEIDLAHDPSLHELLSQVRGASVSLQVRGESNPITGKILTVSSQQSVVDGPGGGTALTQYSLVLLSDATIRTVPLDDVTQLRFTDEKLQAELEKALGAVNDARNADTKPVDITFGRNVTGEIGLGYLIEMPVWKTSYRLSLGDDQEPADQPRVDTPGSDAEGDDPKPRVSTRGSSDDKTTGGAQLQGWAIVENTTDRDWTGVELTLVSGRPISFVQDLYTPLYLQRPEVQPELYASLQPKRYEEGMAGEQEESRAMQEKQLGRASGHAQRRRGMVAAESMDRMSAPAEASAMAGAFADADSGEIAAGRDYFAAAQSATQTGSLGELFRYTIDGDVDLDRRRSAMLPIVNQSVDAQRVSIYNQQTQPDHPLLGAKLTNNTGLKLPSGPITVLDAGAYAGDAQIGFMGPGDDRLLSFGIDLEVKVDPSQTSTARIVGGKIVRGTLQIERRQEWTQTYQMKNNAGTTRTVIVETPRDAARELIEPENAEETTPSLYRFRTKVDADAEKKLVVRTAQVQTQSMALLPMDVGNLLSYSRTGEIPKAVRDAIARAVELKQQQTQLEREIATLEQENQQISEDQNRIRQNMSRVDRNSSIYTRYVEKLNTQETRLEKILDEQESLRTELQAKQRELAEYLNGLNVGG